MCKSSWTKFVVSKHCCFCFQIFLEFLKQNTYFFNFLREVSNRSNTFEQINWKLEKKWGCRTLQKLVRKYICSCKTGTHNNILIMRFQTTRVGMLSKNLIAHLLHLVKLCLFAFYILKLKDQMSPTQYLTNDHRTIWCCATLICFLFCIPDYSVDRLGT